jgi:hypothetical protein
MAPCAIVTLLLTGACGGGDDARSGTAPGTTAPTGAAQEQAPAETTAATGADAYLVQADAICQRLRADIDALEKQGKYYLGPESLARFEQMVAKLKALPPPVGAEADVQRLHDEMDAVTVAWRKHVAARKAGGSEEATSLASLQAVNEAKTAAAGTLGLIHC